jgi:hypothetical protein
MSSKVFAFRLKQPLAEKLEAICRRTKHTPAAVVGALVELAEVSSEPPFVLRGTAVLQAADKGGRPRKVRGTHTVSHGNAGTIP